MNNIKQYKKTSYLYIVPTPIGNLKDITNRALYILKTVQIIAAEDTRRTYLLLNHFSIKNNICSFHKYNEKKKTLYLIKKINHGKNVALVSNSGTPILNDPGVYLIKKCILYGIRIIPLPGACSAITALSASGLFYNKFIYQGFFPKKKNKRILYLKEIKYETKTSIFYESKKRLLQTLKDMKKILENERKIVLAKEITKIKELFIYKKLKNIIQYVLKTKIFKYGEIILILEGFKKKKNINYKISNKILHTFYLLKKELSYKKSISLTAKIYNIKKNILYNYMISNKH